MSSENKNNHGIGKALSFLVFVLFGFIVYKSFNSIEPLNQNIITPTIVAEEVKKEVDVSELDLLGKAEISFAGGTVGRGKNIELGIKRIDGTVVPSGAEFSFTKTLGEVKLEDGFSEERVFLNGEVVKGVGGGLCQVSTTLFRSLINAGLPITERHGHTYTVVLYDTGLDATYADPGPDLKFLNDTANPITIKGRTEDEKAVFEIYGVKDGRVASTTEAEITNIVDVPPTKYMYNPLRGKDEPKCINTPQIGYTSEVKYSVVYRNGETKEQVFKSKYNPLQRICFLELDELTNFGRTKSI